MSVPRPSRLDAVMPYVPALLVGLASGALVYVWSVSVDAPRVWPGTILAFVMNSLYLAHATWRRRRGGGRG